MTIPAWQDISTLSFNLCICDRTVDAWVRQGILPPARLRGGKRLWKWAEVERYLEGQTGPAAAETESLAERIRNGTREAIEERRLHRGR